MSKYFFHLLDDFEVLIDPEGREVEDGQVGAAALEEARAMIAADARSGRIDLRQSIEVRDSAGKVVHRIDFVDAVEIVGPDQEADA